MKPINPSRKPIRFAVWSIVAGIMGYLLLLSGFCLIDCSSTGGLSYLFGMILLFASPVALAGSLYWAAFVSKKRTLYSVILTVVIIAFIAVASAMFTYFTTSS